MKFALKHSQTDWDTYYQKPSIFAKFTRKSTERHLLHYLKKAAAFSPVKTICELGGANSCFFSVIRKSFPEALYTIIDNNEQGVNLFKKNHAEDQQIDTKLLDILASNNVPTMNDVVFSVGLIEHFSPADTTKVIHKHFLCSKPGGLVIITFPTPTWLYKILRFMSEKCHVWIFHDERPLHIADVVAEIEPYARVITSFINWRTLLTQGVIIAETKN